MGTGRVCGAALALCVTGVVCVAACGTAGRPSGPPLRGAVVHVLADWTGAEQANFAAVLRRFTQRTGARVVYRAAPDGVPEALDHLVAAGGPPDVALLPQPGLLRRYATEHRLVPLDPATRAAVAEHYTPVWRSLASVDGREYGVWFKAAGKSLLWYDVGTFERIGAAPPADLPGLVALAGRLRAGRVAAFGVGGADRWVLTDWFENLFLRLAGPDRYSALAEHRIRWTDPDVARALGLLRQLLAPGNVAGGWRSALRTGFDASVTGAFGPRHDAAMVMEGDFVAGVVTSSTPARVGRDVDAVAFPGTFHGLPVVVGGGDVAVAFRATPAARALLAFLATPEAGQLWAARGGFVSPNADVDLRAYPDRVTREIARQVLEAGAGFRFDLSDLQPAGFGSASGGGMQAGLARFVVDGDLPATQRELEAGAAKAFGR